ncbi:MAG: hypothetical protein M1840_005077 [Geoglossum simile]|nr:MAG: hypothetical protein M1840_005077 [Geoglossum simile]
MPSFQTPPLERRQSPESRERKDNGGISPRAPPPNEQSASSLSQTPEHRSVTGETHLEQPSLTEKNLKKLSNLQPTPRYQRTLTPSPPLGAAITPGPEKPRSAGTDHTPEPHQCILGSKCTREIESLNYHRTKAIHLITRARKLNLSVRSLADYYDYDDLAELRDVIEYVTERLLEVLKLGWQGADPKEVLKEVKSPEYWEAERKYLKSPGCLELRQKASASLTGVLPRTSSVENHEPPYRESSAKWRYQRLGSKNKPTALPPSTSGDRRREKGHVALGKRKLTEDVPVDNDTAPKRRCLSQNRPLIQEERKISLDHNPSSPPRGSKNRRRKYRKATDFRASKLDNTASHPRDLTPATRLMAQQTPFSVHRCQMSRIVKTHSSGVASRTRSKQNMESLDMNKILQA